MMRKLTLLLFFAAIPAALHAQVATTDLVPGASRFVHPQATGFNSATYTPDNPAALAWSEPHRVGGGSVNGTFKDKVTGASYDYDGKFAGFRVGGEVFSGAGEIQDVSDNVGGTNFTYETTNAQLSIKVSDTFSIGFGMEADSEGNNDVDRVMGGISFRLGEDIFLGAAIFDDDLNLTGVSGTRNGTMLGVAYRTEGETRIYFAYDVFDVGESVVLGVGQTNGLKYTTTTLQGQYSTWMAGISLLDVSGEGTTSDISATILDVGWVQEAGLSISARITVFSETNAAGTTNDEVTTRSGNLTWMF